MKITAIAPWFGGKRTLAAEVVRQLGPHSAYWEPFGGSLAVLLSKPPASMETISDLHGDLVNLAMVLASDRYGDLREKLEHTLYCEDLFRAAKGKFMNFDHKPPALPEEVKVHDVHRAYWFFVVSWMGRNGVAGTARTNYQMAIRYTSKGGSGPTRFRSAVESIDAWHERLRNVAILRRDAFTLLKKIEDEPGTAIYIDPPYFLDTRADHGCSRYEYDFENEDHAALAQLLNRFEHARVVVSYYDHAKLAEYYPKHARWWKIDCAATKNLHVQNRRGLQGRMNAPEVLLVNGPPAAASEVTSALFEPMELFA